jgi:DNA topoisomerase-1
MSKNLVIVESPAKARTINKYLGKDFRVLASYGHVRDLVPKEGAIDTDDGFAMKYAVIDKNTKHVDAIAKAAAKADALFLATDPDREGEAISWHLLELLRERKALEGKQVHRVVFHEITKKAIMDAVDNPRTISMELVNAQQARRALDYLVGFNLSPLLWKKIQTGLSAGRVQSPALRMIVERELEIEAFVPREYWSIQAAANTDGHDFNARLHTLASERVEQFSIVNADQAAAAKQALTDAAQGVLRVLKVEKKQRRRFPAAPFTTSTLQQEASRKLGFSAQRTMRTAQQLYEGISTDEGAEGLITYMRTDSVTLSQDAVDELRQVIAERYGKDNVPADPQTYRTRSKNAQEAHEAIRPTSARTEPAAVRAHLSDDQFRLYELIWMRTIACQMIHATIDTVGIDLAAGDERNVFRATGSTIADPGFMAVYQEGQDDSKARDTDRLLPPMKEGDTVDLKDILTEQHFTEPPPRFSEASLVRALEEHGIGRPSTYAAIISTLIQRKYATLEARRFRPTDVGRVVNRFLTEHFDQYVDYDFTARLEDDLDAVSRGERDWIPLMQEFWTPFQERVEEKAKVSREEVMQARELGVDPKTGKPVSVRLGRFGPFVQLGVKEDEEKPKFASLREGQSLDTITLEEALPLFNLPRDLGETPEGEPMQANIGRFGPYVRYGKSYVSMGTEDPYTITPERALELVQAKKEADANRIIQSFDDGKVQVLRGRYGPYITDGKKNARMPKDREPESLSYEECLELLAKAPEKKARRAPASRKKKS